MKAYVPLFTEDSVDEEDEEDREEILEQLGQRSYPGIPTWEKLRLSVRPLGVKPPDEADVPFLHSRWKDPPRDKNAKPWPYIYKHGLALATMLRGVPSVSIVVSFLRYHWSIGFNHIFLFFDDPEDALLAASKQFQEELEARKVEGISLSIHPMD